MAPEEASELSCVPANVDFDDTEIAFRSQSASDLKTSYWLFKLLSYPTLVEIGRKLLVMATRWRLPVNGPIRATVFKQFCGGESFEDCCRTIDELAGAGVGTMLDYAVEGREAEDDFESTVREVAQTMGKAEKIPSVRFSVVKMTGLARFSLLE
jgi:proline dehydrogenase